MLDEPTLGEALRARLMRVYGVEAAGRLVPALLDRVAAWRSRIVPRTAGWSEQDALLITYADSILAADRQPLEALHAFLAERVGRRFSFLHLLPFYPYSSDDGFAVTDYRAVRDELGGWGDIERLARDYRIVFDGVINHVSSASRYARGYLAGDPAFTDFFIALDPRTDTSSVLRTRDLPLLHDYPAHDGTRWLWTTFSRDQIDLNFRNPAVLLEILDVLLGYAARGASVIRLDAIPYLWKELGSSCAHLPQTHELIKLIRNVLRAAAPHLLLLTETNVPHRENLAYFGNAGDEAQMIYNFALAPLILWSLTAGDAGHLTAWAAGVRRVGPSATYLNITATHDGIGMRPTEGILAEPERARLVRLAREHGGEVTGKRNSDGTLSPYELNLNYFDAVNPPDGREPLDLQIDRFLLSQAIPLAMIGIPGVYIHSLLGSRNDTDGVKRSGRARSINRERLDLGVLTGALDCPGSLRARVFARMLFLLERRAAQPAFHPDAEQTVPDLGPGFFAVSRRRADTGHALLAVHSMRNAGQTADLSHAAACGICRDILTGERFAAAAVPFAPYAFRWLVADEAGKTAEKQ